MANVPTVEEVSGAIINVVKDMHIRVGDAVPVMMVQVKLGSRYRADELNAAFAYMEGQGMIEEAPGNCIQLTQEGYGPEPTTDEIERAILDEIGGFNLRPGQSIPFQAVWPNLMLKGYRSEEMQAATEGMRAKGYFESGDGLSFLTDKGYAAV